MLKKIDINVKDWMANYNKRVSQARGSVKHLTMCSRCYAFHYKRAWHFERPTYMDQLREQEVPVRFTECTACLKEEDIFAERESTLVSGLGFE